MNFQILYALESIRTPFLDTVLGAITYLGNEYVFMVLAIILYWCVSKKWGYYMLAVGFFGTVANQFAKIVCRIPRPWVRDPGFTIVESARAAAGGYSFPSGHTNSIVAAFGCIALIVKKRWVRIVCIVVIVLVAFSRMYLGVHYPTDVAFSLVVGVMLVFAAYPIFAKADEKPEWVAATLAVLTFLSLAFTVYVDHYPFPADTDPANLAHAVKNGWTLTGCGLAMLVSMWLDRRYLRFEVEAPLWAQIVKTAVGLGLLLAIKAALKPLLAAIFGDAQITHAIRYFCVVFFAGYLWPLTFRWFAAGCPLRRKDAKSE